jgi:hypothetical protein|tara:strand:- start:97 stop:285 length:189 start_codon:yes stop_codon:yes gene_type:complete
MTDKNIPIGGQLSDLQQTQRGILVDNRWSFVFSTNINDWIWNRVRQQQVKSRKRIKNGKTKK